MISSTVGSVTTSYFYDSQSRRIAKSTGTNSTLYVYDGWNCISEYEWSSGVSLALSKTRLWGTDLSDGLQGAGGVGGLLKETQIAGSLVSEFYPTYDGNGNVSEYLDNTGAASAHFEYDPFGNTVVNTDTSEKFDYRFSTKPLNSDTGLYYYGYRDYDPSTGRWPSRDPVEEEGGGNLLAMVGNDIINFFDFLGLKPGDAFECEDAAAVDALNTIKPSGTDGKNTEQGGLIYEKDGKHYATEPRNGDPRSSQGTSGHNRPYDSAKQIPKGDFHKPIIHCNPTDYGT